MQALVTGAAGCVGSALAELLKARGHEVRALVREGSDTAFLKTLDVELTRGDLGDRPSLDAAVRGVDAVFHCAALVGDWVSLDEMRRVNVEGLGRLLEASAAAGVRRFIYMSSMVVLGADRQDNLDETAPYVFTGDNYNTTKIEAEKLLMEFAAAHKLAVTVVRAPYVYGPRDRQMFPRILQYLARGKYAYIGGGDVPFTLVYSGNLAEGLLKAARNPAAAGKVYNITDGAPVTRRQLIERMADELGLPRPKKNVPYPVAVAVCALCEAAAKLFRLKPPPILNRFRLKFMTAHLTFDISKARRELGYEPRIPFDRALKETVAWFKANGKTR